MEVLITKPPHPPPCTKKKVHFFFPWHVYLTIKHGQTPRWWNTCAGHGKGRDELKSVLSPGLEISSSSDVPLPPKLLGKRRGESRARGALSQGLEGFRDGSQLLPLHVPGSWRLTRPLMSPKRRANTSLNSHGQGQRVPLSPIRII